MIYLINRINRQSAFVQKMYLVTVKYIPVLNPKIYIIFTLDGWVHMHYTMLVWFPIAITNELKTGNHACWGYDDDYYNNL